MKQLKLPRKYRAYNQNKNKKLEQFQIREFM